MNSRVGTEAVGLLCLSCASEPSALLYAKCRDPATTFGKPLMAASQSKMLKRQCLDRKENTACYNVNQCYTTHVIQCSSSCLGHVELTSHRVGPSDQSPSSCRLSKIPFWLNTKSEEPGPHFVAFISDYRHDQVRSHNVDLNSGC